MYGILLSYKTYLEINTMTTIEDVLKEDDGIQGIFTGNNGDFMIIGKILETVDSEDNKPLIIPELCETNMEVIRNLVKKKYNIDGEFNYYFIKK